MGISHARRAKKHDILSTVQEPQGCKIRGDRQIERWLKTNIELMQPFSIGNPANRIWSSSARSPSLFTSLIEESVVR
jgi:hypothetical protein